MNFLKNLFKTKEYTYDSKGKLIPLESPKSEKKNKRSYPLPPQSSNGDGRFEIEYHPSGNYYLARYNNDSWKQLNYLHRMYGSDTVVTGSLSSADKCSSKDKAI